MRIWRSESGFSIAEVSVVAALVGMVLAAVLVVQESGIRAYIIGSNRVGVQQTARIALERMGREIREASAITTANANSVTFTAQDGVTVVTYAVNANNLERNGDVIVGGVDTLSFVYRGFNDAPGTTAADTRRIDITIRTRPEDVPSGSQWNVKAEITTSVRLRNVL